MVGIMRFQVVEDGPYAFGAGSIQIDKNRHGIARILGHDGIAGDTLLSHHQAGKAASGRQHQVNQAAHWACLQRPAI